MRGRSPACFRREQRLHTARRPGAQGAVLPKEEIKEYQGARRLQGGESHMTRRCFTQGGIKEYQGARRLQGGEYHMYAI